MKSQPNAKGGMYVLNEDIEMKADGKYFSEHGVGNPLITQIPISQ